MIGTPADRLIILPKSELIDLTALALENSQIKESSLKDAMYLSPGGSDEFMPLFLWEKELDRQEIEDLKGKLKGVRTQGEMITLRVVNYEYLWKEGARDAKTMAAWGESHFATASNQSVADYGSSDSTVRGTQSCRGNTSRDEAKEHGSRSRSGPDYRRGIEQYLT
jgi:hypothetical protein